MSKINVPTSLALSHNEATIWKISNLQMSRITLQKMSKSHMMGRDHCKPVAFVYTETSLHHERQQLNQALSTLYPYWLLRDDPTGTPGSHTFL